MRGLRSTLLLLVVLGALVAYIYYQDRRGPVDDRELAFASLDADDIEEVQITASDGTTTVVRKEDDAWQIVEPVQVEADEGELLSITSSLASIDIQRVVDEEADDLAQYGLDPARIAVAFRTAGDEEPRRILFGERTPTGGDLYASFPDRNRVFLVSSFLDSTFNKNTFALREKNVIRLDRSTVERVEIVAGSRRMTLAKSGAEWRLTEPIAARADFAAVEGALERLGSARMQGIVDAEAADLKALRLDPPVASFTAVSPESRATLLFGETEDALIYAKDASRPMVFTVAPTLYSDVIRTVDDFRRKDLFDARSFTTNRIEFRRGEDTVVLDRSKADDGTEAWRTADGAQVDATVADDLLTTLTSLRADSFDTPVDPALRQPLLSVTVTFAEDRTEQVAFARSNGGIVASRADEPGSARVDAAAFEEVLEELDAQRGKWKVESGK